MTSLSEPKFVVKLQHFGTERMPLGGTVYLWSAL